MRGGGESGAISGLVLARFGDDEAGSGEGTSDGDGGKASTVSTGQVAAESSAIGGSRASFVPWTAGAEKALMRATEACRTGERGKGLISPPSLSSSTS